jgi:hypothetical protein
MDTATCPPNKVVADLYVITATASDALTALLAGGGLGFVWRWREVQREYRTILQIECARFDTRGAVINRRNVDTRECRGNQMHSDPG